LTIEKNPVNPQYSIFNSQYSIEKEGLLKNLSDDEVIAEIKSGNKKAFDELYERYYKYVFRTCLKKLGNVQDAEDLTQDIFTKIIETLPNYESRGKFRGYVNVIIKNAVISKCRKKKEMISLDDEEQEHIAYSLKSKTVSPEKAVEDKELLTMIYTAIDKISSPKYKQVIKMRLLNEMTTKEIAEILGCSENAVRIGVHRGYEELRKIMKGELNAD